MARSFPDALWFERYINVNSSECFVKTKVGFEDQVRMGLG